MDKMQHLLGQFILEFRQALSGFDVTEFQNAKYRYMTETELITALDISPDIYCEYIDKAINNLNTVSVNFDILLSFFEKIKDTPLLKEKNITIPVQKAESIERIRPEYLNNIPYEFKTAVSKVLTGEYGESDVRKEYATGKYFDKVKKQIARTNLSSDTRDLIQLDSPDIVKIDRPYIEGQILPFVRAFPQNAKDILGVAYNVKGRISNNFREIKSILAAIGELESKPNNDAKKMRNLAYLKYNVVRQYMCLCAYLSSLVIRKIRYYTFNMTSYTNLYNTFSNYFPEGDLILHENALDGNPSDLTDEELLTSALQYNLQIVVPYIQKCVGRYKMLVSNIMASKYETNVRYDDPMIMQTYKYDIQPYNGANQAIKSIIGSFQDFSVQCQDPNLIVEDLLSSTGLNGCLVERNNSVIQAIKSIEYYSSQMAAANEDGAVYMAVYNDISRFDANMDTIFGNVKSAYSILKDIQTKFDTNSYNHDESTYNELREVVNKLEENYKNFVLTLAKAFLARLDVLCDFISPNEIQITDANEETPFPTDYNEFTYLEDYDRFEKQEKEIFEQMLKDYHRIRVRKDTGVRIVYEADEQPTQQNQPQNQQQEKQSTTPDVKTDAPTQHANNNANETNAPGNKTANQKESVVEAFKRLWAAIVSKFREKCTKLSKKNDQWIASVKSSIQNLNFENTEITCAQYPDVNSNTIVKDCNDAISKIKGINASSPPPELSSREKAERFLFPRIPAKIGNANTFPEKIHHFMTFGNTNESKLKKYAGEDCKNKVDAMIDYAENYANLTSEISKQLDRLTDEAATMQQNIVNSKGTQSDVTVTKPEQKPGEQKPSVQTESVFLFEADEQPQSPGEKAQADKQKENDVNMSKVIIDVVRDYQRTVLTILEKKYSDYILILKKLAPKRDNAPTTNNENKEEAPKEGETQ